MTPPLSRAAIRAVREVDTHRKRLLLTGVLLCAMIVLMSVAYGFQYRADSAHPLGYFLPFSALYFLCLVALIAAGLRPWTMSGGERQRTATVVGLMLTTAALATTLYFTEGQLPFSALPMIAGLLIVVGGATALAGADRAMWFVLLLGLIVQIALALGNPLDVAAANMLPVIEAGCGKLLAGENPYLAEYPGITSVPLMYLPGLLLPYCAPVAVGLDVRALNIILLVTIIGYAVWAFDFRHRPERLSLAFLPLLFSPIAAQMMVHGHVWLYWLTVLIFVHALATRQFLAAALLLGLMLGTRQMSLFLAIPVAAYMMTRLDPSALLRYGATSVAVYVVMMAPVMLTTPNWVDLFYLSSTRVGAENHLIYGNPMNQVSLSGLLTELGLAGSLRPLQIATLLLAVAAFWIWRRCMDVPRALVLLGACYVLVIGLNVFLHRYFYMPGLVLLALGVAYAAAPLTADDGKRRPG